MPDNILIAPTLENWADLAARRVLKVLQDSLDARGEASLVLSGGSTPKIVYQRITTMQPQIDWGKVFIFWSDERCVPPNHPDSNYGMAKANLLNHLHIPAQNIIRMIGEIEPQAAALDYDEMISAYFHNKDKRFDLILLGLGEDGHTASLFPGTPALKEITHWVKANPHPNSDNTRLTLTFPALNAAQQVYFLVTGSNKAQVVKEVIHEPELPPPHPAKQVTGTISPPIWILDAKAGANL